MKTSILVALAIVLSEGSPSLSHAAANYVYLSCERSYKKWLKEPEHWMAFAQNETYSGSNVCGWGKGFSTRGAAKNAAIRQCRLAEREHPTWGKKNSCAIIKVR